MMQDNQANENVLEKYGRDVVSLAKEGKIDWNEKHKQPSTVILYKIDIGIFYNN